MGIKIYKWIFYCTGESVPLTPARVNYSSILFPLTASFLEPSIPLILHELLLSLPHHLVQGLWGLPFAIILEMPCASLLYLIPCSPGSTVLFPISSFDVTYHTVISWERICEKNIFLRFCIYKNVYILSWHIINGLFGWVVWNSRLKITLLRLLMALLHSL